MGNAVTSEIAAIALALLVVIALLRIYFSAVLPVWRNWRLARRGFSDEPSYRRERGTLLKWLIRIAPAIVVIAILAAIAIPAYQDYVNRAQSVARDQERIADLAAIQNALDGYHLAHNAYPVSEGEAYDSPTFTAVLDPLVSEGFLASLPNDPSGPPISFVYQSTPDGTYYCLGANTEGAPPPSTCDTAMLGAALDTNYMIGP